MDRDRIREDRRPLYEQAQSAIVARIAEGVYQPGEKLPPEDQLAAGLGISRVTLRSALSHLETLGYIERIHGLGTFVSRQRFKVAVQLDSLESFYPRLTARMGRPSKISHLDIQAIPANEEVATTMGLRMGEPVISIERTVEIDQVPIVHLQDYLPPALCNCGVETFRAGFDSVVDYFDGRDGRPIVDWCDSNFETVRASAELAERLQVGKGDVLLRLDEVFYTHDNRLVNWGRCYIVPQYFKFHIRRRVVHGEAAASGGQSSNSPAPSAH